MAGQREPTFVEEIEAALEAERDPAFADLDDAALERAFRRQAAEVAAATCRWLLLLAEVVRRGIWAEQDARTPTEWLSWAVSIAPSTAREHVRVALRLKDFPEVTARFSRGELSYSKVRAITRLNRPELERELLAYAEAATGAQLERIVSGMRGNERARERAADPHADRSASWTISEDGASVVFRIQLPLVEGLEAGEDLDAWARELAAEARRDRASAEASEAEPMPAHRADAFLDAVRARRDADPEDGSGADRHTLVLHADVADLADPGPGRDRSVPVRSASGTRMASMSARAIRRLACTARLALIGHDDDGDECAVSGTTRKVPARLRRLLLARDRTCRFPGCEARRGLDAHHIVHWADGGPTEAANLVLLCSFHHHRVHDRGWRIHHDGRGRVRFQAPSGAIRPTVVPMPQVDPLAVVERNRAEGMTVIPRKLQADSTGGRPDHHLCVELLEEALRRLEPPADPVARAA